MSHQWRPAKQEWQEGEGDRCDVCSKCHGVTYNFRSTLAAHNIRGEKATIRCIRHLNLMRSKPVPLGLSSPEFDTERQN